MAFYAFVLLIASVLGAAYWVLDKNIYALSVAVPSLVLGIYLLWKDARNHLAETAERISITGDLLFLQELRGSTIDEREFFKEIRITAKVTPAPGGALFDIEGVPAWFVRQFFADSHAEHEGKYFKAIRNYRNTSSAPLQDWAGILTRKLWDIGEVEWSQGNRPARIVTSWDSCWESLIPVMPKKPHNIIFNKGE